MADLGSYGLKREELFLTTKLSPADQGKGNCKKAILDAVKKLQVAYIDLVLIHWPGSSKLAHDDPKNAERRKGSWEDLEELHSEGIVKSIGVSNYTIRHLEEMINAQNGYAKIKPVVNQVEVHPLFFDKELIDFCSKNSIVVQAYSSLGAADGWPVLAENATLKQVASKYSKSVAQILLKWALQHNLCIIPKTSKVENLKLNFDLFNFELSNEDMVAIDALNKNKKFCWDPSTIC
ncbi:PREDICTED: glyoxal reductase-like [Rhagoletis zephyria]|uniref:glyoxal reductase-like n=1 Tax=Rhagoletis zephyria TaxID=28612 RepID=UPI000811418C|nr:PREDICTED: glyoxal reductase-like [Rhagoletis zephyria]